MTADLLSLTSEVEQALFDYSERLRHFDGLALWCWLLVSILLMIPNLPSRYRLSHLLP